MSGIAAFPKSHDLRAIFAAAPLDRVLVETDSPYLAPPPYRGKRNEPAYTVHTARVGAEVFGVDYPAEFAAATTANFDRLFTRPPLGEGGLSMAELRFTILGCGSSGGVPRLGGHWGDCDPDEPRNTRRRCSMLVQRFDEGGETAVLIDTSPDLRQQLLDTGIGRLDGVIYTHSHADHVHGLDDLRMIVFNMRQRLPVWADGPTQNDLLHRFGYAFVQPEGSAYPAILDLHAIDGDVTIEGAGGPITFRPFEVTTAPSTRWGSGSAISPICRTSPTSPTAPGPCSKDLDCWVLDALRRTPHPSHAHLEKSLELDRARRAPAGGADQHAYRHGLPHRGRRNPRPCRARP
jgi:phosphoribosyl 1,2-cyclic phosphate phosphodiesterase